MDSGPGADVGQGGSRAGDREHMVVAHLASGEQLAVAACSSAEQAHDRAKTFIRELGDRPREEWLLLGMAYVRPDSVVSIHLVEEAARTWSGSHDRSRWGAPAERPGTDF